MYTDTPPALPPFPYDPATYSGAQQPVFQTMLLTPPTPPAPSPTPYIAPTTVVVPVVAPPEDSQTTLPPGTQLATPNPITPYNHDVEARTMWLNGWVLILSALVVLLAAGVVAWWFLRRRSKPTV